MRRRYFASGFGRTVRGKKSRDEVDRILGIQPLDDTQLPQLGLHRQAAAAFGLTRCRAAREHLVQPAARVVEKLRL